MAEKTTKWRRVTDCALSNSIHRRGRSAERIPEAETASILDYLRTQGGLTQEDAREVYAQGVERAGKQRRPDGSVPVWVILAFVIGSLGVTMNVINIFLVGFSLVFVLFLLVAGGMVSSAIDCLIETDPQRKAAYVWNRACRNGSEAELAEALRQMSRQLKN